MDDGPLTLDREAPRSPLDDAPGSLTILELPPGAARLGRRVCKRFYTAGTDTGAPEVRAESYNAGSRFLFSVVPLYGLADLYREIDRLQHNRDAFVIRGSVRTDLWVSEETPCGGPIERVYRPREGLPRPPLVDAARPWLCLDIDGFVDGAGHDADPPAGLHAHAAPVCD